MALNRHQEACFTLAPLPTCSILLHNPEGPINLGAIARAMANTGFESLAWTGSLAADHPQASKFAVHAKRILQQAQTKASFQALIRDTDLLIGFSPRAPWEDGRNISLDECLEKIATMSESKKVGLLFGNEAFGLENEHLAYCHYRVALPTHIDYASMNLAQAVLVVLWEIRRRAIPVASASTAPQAISSEERQILLKNLRHFADSMEYLNPQNPERLWKELLAIFQTRDWTPREAQILNGLFAKGSARYKALLKKKS